MFSYFISDLHLSAERPDISQAFLRFLQEQAPQAEKVFILGDLFEYWVGDDAASALKIEHIVTAMQQLSKQTKTYFMPGNRDFLIGKQFAKQSGFKILKDETVIDLYGNKTLLLHGDSLCTDDIEHQKFRRKYMLSWLRQFLFLRKPLAERLEIAQTARQQSKQNKKHASISIMDVTEQSVIKSFEKYSVQQMIHGHTHRQNTHQHNTKLGLATRYVLGDWDITSNVLSAFDDGTIKIYNAPIA